MALLRGRRHARHLRRTARELFTTVQHWYRLDVVEGWERLTEDQSLGEEDYEGMTASDLIPSFPRRGKLFSDWKLTRTAEGSARFYPAFDDSQFSTPRDESVCAKFEQLLNESDVREASNSAAQTSGVHDVIGELSRPRLLSTCSIRNFDHGLFNTESAPKDIVFLIDFSGSVKGPTMHLIKVTMMYILSTLSPNDYFFWCIFQFRLCSDSFMCQWDIFFERLGELEEKDQAHVSAPLRFSLDALRGDLNSTNSVFPNYRSGGHKLLMLFTDGLDEWPHAVMDEELHNRHGDVIRMFGFSMGYGTGQLPLLHWIACRTFAKYSIIDSIMDVKPQSRSYLDHLSAALGRSLETTPIEARRIS
ncbi:hypothetical protein OSTOST_10720, partial [Ostertagia ostertagi]